MTASARDDVERILESARRGAAVERSRSLPRRRSFYERARRRRGGWVLSLNLTPMIDTVFNLLFLFMMISRFGAIEGLLPASLPTRSETPAAASAGPAIPVLPLRVRLQAGPGDSCEYRIDRLVEHPSPIRELPARLSKIRETEPGFDAGTPVYLMAGDSIAWDHVVNAYNAALSARYEKIYFGGEK